MLTAAARLFTAGVLFIGSSSNRVVKSFGSYRVKHHLLNLSPKQLTRQLVSLSLIVAILTTSTPAASTIPSVTTGMITNLGEIGQDIRYAYLANFQLSQTFLINVSDSLASVGYFGNPVLALLVGGTSKNRKQQRQTVARLEISPNAATIRDGEQIAFAGVAYDAQNQIVQGVRFNWKAIDGHRKSPQISLQNGIFEPQFSGTWTIIAEAGGIVQETQIIVLEDAQLRALREADKSRKSENNQDKAKKGKAKALPNEVNELLKQQLPAPVNNSSRMTDTRELEKWDTENKKRKVPEPKPQTPPQQQQQTGNNIQRENFDDDDEHQSVFIKTGYEGEVLLRRGGTKGGPRADENEISVESNAEKNIKDSSADQSQSESSAEVTSGYAAGTRFVTPTGFIDSVDGFGRVRGWTYDPNSSSTSILVHFYIDGPAGQGTIIGYSRANEYRPDVNQAYGISGNHGYSFIIPSRYFDGQTHRIYAYGIGVSYNNNKLLFNSPTYFALSSGGNPNWNNGNFTTADDPGVQPGAPPNEGTAGAGSGNFSFSAPVISLGGRGDLGMNLSLNYNSLLWHKGNGQITYDIDKGYPAKGWTIGFGKMMDMGSYGGTMLEDPSGTRHSYDGTIQGGYSGGYSTYYGHTTDGSFIDYQANMTPYGINSGTATMANGTTIQYGANYNNAIYPTYIRDRHGNYMTITYVDGIGPNISTITDNLGRVITFNYDSSNRLVSITGPGQNNTTRTLVRIHHRSLHLDYAFTGLTPLVQDADVDVVDGIYYPDTNTGYWFGENDSYSSYGMIAKVIESRGMTWSGSGNNDQGTLTAGTMTRQTVYNYPLTANGSLSTAPLYTQTSETWANMDTAAAVTSYSIQSNSNPRLIALTMPNGTVVKQYSKYNPGQWDDGILYQTEIVSPSNQVLSKSVMNWALGEYGAPRVTDVSSTDEKNQTTKQEFTYTGSYNQVATIKDYGYSNNLLRTKSNTYENGAGYIGYYNSNGIWSWGRHIFSLVKSEELLDANNVKISKTDYAYDGANLVDAPGVVMYEQTYNPYTSQTVDGDCLNGESYWVEDDPYNGFGHWEFYCTEYEQVPNFDSGTLARGNVTKIRVYADAASSSGAIDYDSTYDITGNARTTTTDCCQQMSFNYTTNTQYSQPESHTKGSSDPNSAARMTESATYDFNTGHMNTSTDFNGRTTTYYYDAVNRPVQTVLPTGGKSMTEYNNADLWVAQTAQLTDNTIASKSVVYANGRGQTQVSQQWTGTGWNASKTVYDVMGRTYQTSMPFDASGQPSQWTTYSYDQLSRITQVTAPDGSISQTIYNAETAAQVPGQTVRSRDAWGRERWARTDDFGRVVEVREPNPNGNGDVTASGNLLTTYSYDAKDQLVQVNQGSQTRAFAYDSLGRLTRQKLAEQNGSLNAAGQFVGANQGLWSDAFFYDVRSNLIQRVDARGVKANFSYQAGGVTDPLNRLQSVSYDKSQADPTYPVLDTMPVALSYMTSGDKTRVAVAETGNLIREENSYDTEGRISEYKFTTLTGAANALVTGYLYDSLSRLTEVRYPAQYGMPGAPRKVVNPAYDETSRLKELKVDNQIQMNEIVYNPMSQVTQLKTGAATNNADVETYSYDGQTGLLTNQKVIKANTSAALLDLSYEYNRGNSNGSVNGRTGQLTHIVNNLDRNKDRVFEFDTLGRLVTAKGGAATGVQGVTASWTQSYAYDRYGNRTNVTANGITANSQNVPTDGVTSQSYDQTSNRINTSGYEYDLAGNLTRGQDASGNWRRFKYDGAGRLINVYDDAGSQEIVANFYGASRQRMIGAENGSSDYTIYAWGGSSVIAEYTFNTANPTIVNWKKSYIYAGSRLLTTYTKDGSGERQEFHHPDRLGTKLVTNNVANTSFEQATLPFGTALDAESTGATNQRFTTYDRSAATGIDYAVNRHYSAAQGRFTSVDPIGMSAASIGNPQSNNLYAYVENNPVNFTDPSGLTISEIIPIAGGGFCVDYMDWDERTATVTWRRECYFTSGGSPGDKINPRQPEPPPSGGGNIVPLPGNLRDRLVNRADTGDCAAALERLINKAAEITGRDRKKKIDIGSLYDDKKKRIKLDSKLAPFQGRTNIRPDIGGNDIKIGQAPKGFNGFSDEQIAERYTYVVLHELTHNAAKHGAYTDAELLDAVIAIYKEDGKKPPTPTTDPDQASQSINRNYIGQHCGTKN